MSKTIQLNYGTKRLELNVEDGFMGEYLGGPRPVSGQPDPAGIQGEMRKAVLSAAGSKRPRELAKGRKVALIIPDEFRFGHMDDYLRFFAEELKDSGFASLYVLVSTGSHDPIVFTKNLRLSFEKYFGGWKDVLFQANDITKEGHVSIGKTKRGTPLFVHPLLLETELRLYCHEGKHHYMNGYSVIDKLVLPGLSGMKTIEANHKLSLESDKACAGRNPYVNDKARQDNPMASDLQEASRIANRHIMDGGRPRKAKKGEVIAWGMDMLSTKDRVIWAAAGDIAAVEKELVRQTDRWASFKVKRSRYAVVSPGGPPASTTIYSAQNSFDMALKGAVLDGAEALVLAPCDGSGGMPPGVRGLAPSVEMKELFWDMLVKLKDLPYAESRKYIEDNFVLGLWKTNRMLDLYHNHRIRLYLHSTLPPEVVKAGGLFPVSDPQAWLDERAARGDGKVNILDEGNRILVLGE